MKGRQWIFGAMAAAGLFAATAAWQRTGKSEFPAPGAVQAQASAPADTFRLVWSEPIPDLRSASLSANGTAIVTVGSNGDVQLWDWAQRPNRPLWRRYIPGIAQAVISENGRVVLAYTPLDPTRPSIVWIGKGGKPLGRSTLNGAVWDAAISPSGNEAGVTTGSETQAVPGYLYLYSLLPIPTLRKKQQLAGVGDSVSFGSGGTCLAVGTWNNSGISCFTAKGISRWQYPKSVRLTLADRLFTVQIAQADSAVLGMSFNNAHASDATLYYWRQAAGSLSWRYALGQGTTDPCAMISENGQNIAVTYTQQVTHGDRSVAEQRLIMLDADGNLLWQKGGLLFAPRLASISADGHRVTVWDGKNTFYHLDASGRITTPYRFRAPIRFTVSTTNGQWLLVSTQDDTLSLLQIGSQR